MPKNAPENEENYWRTVDGRLLIDLVWGWVLMFLPPSVINFRNPPPANLVWNWYVRFFVAVGMAVFNADCLFFALARGRWFHALWHGVSLLFAVAIAALLFHWVFEFPYPFGLDGMLGPHGWLTK